MAITLLYGCCQIETCARVLDDARNFFREVLGAFAIEQELAGQIDRIAPGTNYGCDHLGLGEAVFQINQPDPEMVFNGHPSIHQAYLDRVGPCVTNLNFFVDDHVHARQLLSAMGAPLHIEGPSTAAKALAEYGPDNTRAGGEDRPFLFLGTRALIGFDLEIMEPNFRRFSEQTVQYPAFVQPRPTSVPDDLVLERLRVVVPDLELLYDKLTRIFAPASRSKPYAYQSGPLGRAFRIGLGGIEIEYCQPLGPRGELAEQLARYGAGVTAIDFTARDLDAVAARIRRRVPITPEPDWFGRREVENTGFWVASRDPIGFDTVVKPGAALFLDRWRSSL